jgi:hypothetical protein
MGKSTVALGFIYRGGQAHGNRNKGKSPSSPVIGSPVDSG